MKKNITKKHSGYMATAKFPHLSACAKLDAQIRTAGAYYDSLKLRRVPAPWVKPWAPMDLNTVVRAMDAHSVAVQPLEEFVAYRERVLNEVMEYQRTHMPANVAQSAKMSAKQLENTKLNYAYMSTDPGTWKCAKTCTQAHSTQKNGAYTNLVIKTMQECNAIVRAGGNIKDVYYIRKGSKFIPNAAYNRDPALNKADAAYMRNNYGGRVFHEFYKEFNDDVIDLRTDAKVEKLAPRVYNVGSIVARVYHGSKVLMPDGTTWRYENATEYLRYRYTAKKPIGDMAQLYYEYGLEKANEVIKDRCFKANNCSGAAYTNTLMALATQMAKYNLTAKAADKLLGDKVKDALDLEDAWDMYRTAGARAKLNAKGISDEQIVDLVGPTYFDIGCVTPMIEDVQYYVDDGTGERTNRTVTREYAYEAGEDAFDPYATVDVDNRFNIRKELTTDYKVYYSKNKYNQCTYGVYSDFDTGYKNSVRTGYGNRFLDGPTLGTDASDLTNTELDVMATQLDYFLNLPDEIQAEFLPNAEALQNDYDKQTQADLIVLAVDNDLRAVATQFMLFYVEEYGEDAFTKDIMSRVSTDALMDVVQELNNF